MKVIIIVCLAFLSSTLYGQDCVLLHGWLGDGNIWQGTGVKGVIQNEYHFDRILQPHLGGTLSALNQSLNFRNYLINHHVSNALTISYSMGGMNTRYHLKRQFELGQPSRIGYHFTIGSPHIGALLADNSSQAASRLLIVSEAALRPFGRLLFQQGGIVIQYYLWESALYAAILTGADYFNQLIHNIGGEALIDLKMVSEAVNYINYPNTNYENSVAKVGITGIEDYPQVYRTAAHSVGWSENQMLNTVDYVIGFKILVLINDFIRYAEYPTSQNLSLLSESLGTLSIVLEFPKAWNVLVTGDVYGESDGVVQRLSQNYPNHNLQLYA